MESRQPWVTVLAGGIGSRFWPASTPDHPKQLLRLASDRPLIVDTVERARSLTSSGRVRILAGRHLVAPMRSALPELEEEDFFVEPRARGTGPVLAWAAWKILQEDPGAVLVSLHSDHVVRPPDRFAETVRAAVEIAARDDLLMTVAIPPTRPEVGYGYIQPGAPVEPTSVDEPDAVGEPDPVGDPITMGEDGVRAALPRAFRVASFHEKPDQATATRYVEEGFSWNSGIFIWPVSTFLDEVRRHAPEIGRHLSLLEDGPEGGDQKSAAAAFFDAVEPISVDEAVLERSERVGAVEALFEWDDVGNWEAMSRTMEPDEHGNVARGRAHFVRSEGNVVYTEGEPIVLFGVDDLVAVRTGTMTLVTRRELAPHLKELLEELPEDLSSS